MAPFVERGDHVSCSGAVILDARDPKLDHVADIQQSRALVHVLVEPPLADREVKLLHQVGQPGVEGPEERHRPLEELERHEGVRRKGLIKVVDAMGEEGEEAVDGVGRTLHGGEKAPTVVGGGGGRVSRRW